MSRLSRLSDDPSSSRLLVTVLLNVVCIGVVISLRYVWPTTFQHPTLSIPNVDDFSVVSWFANRLADIVTLIQLILRYLVRP